jgi:hypothetical protein
MLLSRLNPFTSGIYLDWPLPTIEICWFVIFYLPTKTPLFSPVFGLKVLWELG